MENKTQPTPADTTEPTYLELLAYLGITRHLGGINATREMAKLCNIVAGMHILDIGCGVGRSACRLAKMIGCKVTGVDLSPRMVAWANERARKEKLTALVEFRQADAQSLPFEDEMFDALIVESVMVFVPDRPKAMSEFLRVVKPGGYIGLNESTWLKTPVPEEIVQKLSALFNQADFTDAAGWNELLTTAGLKEIVSRVYALTPGGDLRDRMRLNGFRGVLENIRNMISYYHNATPAQRGQFNRLLNAQRHSPKEFYEYQGYGLYAGRK